MLFDPCADCGCPTVTPPRCFTLQVMFCASSVGSGGNPAKAGVPVEIYTNSTRAVRLDSGVTDSLGRATVCVPSTGTYYAWVPPYDVSTGGGHSITIGTSTTFATVWVLATAIDPAWLCAASYPTCAGDPIRVIPRVLTLTDRFGTWSQAPAPATRTFYCVGEAESVFKLVPDPSSPSGDKCARVDGTQTFAYYYDYTIFNDGTVGVQRWYQVMSEGTGPGSIRYPADCGGFERSSNGILAYSSCRGLYASGVLTPPSDGFDPVGGTVVLSL